MRPKLHDPNVHVQIIVAHSSPLPSWRRHQAGRVQKIQESGRSNLCINRFENGNGHPKGLFEVWFVVPVHDWGSSDTIDCAFQSQCGKPLAERCGFSPIARSRFIDPRFARYGGHAFKPRNSVATLPVAMYRDLESDTIRKLFAPSATSVVQHATGGLAQFGYGCAICRRKSGIKRIRWGSRTANALIHGLRSLR